MPQRASMLTRGGGLVDGLDVGDAAGGVEHADTARVVDQLERDTEIGRAVERIGITAGASAPEVLVRGVIEQLREWGATGMDELEGRPENVTFSMPKELRVRAV